MTPHGVPVSTPAICMSFIVQKQFIEVDNLVYRSAYKEMPIHNYVQAILYEVISIYKRSVVLLLLCSCLVFTACKAKTLPEQNSPHPSQEEMKKEKAVKEKKKELGTKANATKNTPKKKLQWTEQTKPKIVADYITTHYPKATPDFQNLEQYLIRNDEFANQGDTKVQQNNNAIYDVVTRLIGMWVVSEDYTIIREAAKKYYNLEASLTLYKPREPMTAREVSTLGIVFDSMKALTTEFLARR